MANQFSRDLARVGFEFDRLLRLVAVARPRKQFEFGQLFVGLRTLRHHPLDGESKDFRRLAIPHFLGGRDALAAGVVGVVLVHLQVPLLAGELDLFSIDDDDEVAGVGVRRVRRLMFAAKQVGDDDRQSPDDLIRRVDDQPLRVGRFGVYQSRGHDSFVPKVNRCAGLQES